MDKSRKLQRPLWRFLFFILILATVSLAFAVLWARNSNRPDRQTDQDSPSLRYLPTVIRENSTIGSAMKTRAETVGTASADRAKSSDDEHGWIVDATEDYKALGYTDSRKLVRDDEGNLYVAYRKKWEGQYRIFVAKSTDQGESWHPLNGKKPIETSGAYTQRVPSLAIGRTPENNRNFLHLVWYGNDQEHTGNERQIKYLRLTTEGKLSADSCCTLSVNIAGYNGQTLWQEHPTIYVNGSNVYLVWEGRDATSKNAKIKFVRSTDFGQAWTEPIDLDPARNLHLSRPTLAVTYVDKARQLVVAAYGEENKRSQIFWTRSFDNGKSWETWQPVAATATDQRHVSMARDKAGNLHLVWRETTADNSRTLLRYRVYDPTLQEGDGGWATEAQTIAAQPDQCLFFPSIAIGSDDRVWIIWTQSDDCHSVPSDNPTAGQIVYRVKAADGMWDNPITLTKEGAHTYASLRSVHTPNKETMDVVWLDVSQCISEEPQQNQESDKEADVVTSANCLIRYKRLK